MSSTNLPLRTLAVVLLGLVGTVLPARAGTTFWADQAVASTQFSALIAATPPVFDALALENCLMGGDPASCSADLTNLVSDIAAAPDETQNGPFAAVQATGAPDTPDCGSFPTAWAPLFGDPIGDPVPPAAEPELLPQLLVLTYDTPISNPTSIDIYESNIGGFVQAVAVILADGSSLVVFAGTDPTSCPVGQSVALNGVLHIPVTSVAAPIVSVVIETAVPGFEEIDAVGINAE